MNKTNPSPGTAPAQPDSIIQMPDNQADQLAAVLARADAAGLPCYLETLSERNLPFYERYGFQVTFSGEVPEGGPMAWAMVRPSQ